MDLNNEMIASHGQHLHAVTVVNRDGRHVPGDTHLQQPVDLKAGKSILCTCMRRSLCGRRGCIGYCCRRATPSNSSPELTASPGPHLHIIALVDRDGRHVPFDMHIERLAVDEPAHGDQVPKNHARAHALLDGDRPHPALHLRSCPGASSV